ncbi:sensor domain-containing diguanylate cyclase [Thalassotalea piscium]|uniref:diguanylate cyclase n=1 Tax=Thalassotalea piscium TaxID=1230533 RepID=A0A7X0TSB9_9GAMM|nr:sensor domain-containing diguanylate cyclase [Thalassotalea piscium]MBB6541949.1 diguanylate cyclase (GGDEF)-like protein [Thalassotalea piscium]
MRFNYRIVFIITGLLFTLSTSLTLINYIDSMDTTRKQLKTASLPLTLDNIYTQIQKQIIEPNLIASVMSNDTFMKDWLAHEESDADQITQYLKSIKDKYQMFTVFLVSEESKNYYSNEGLLEKVSPDNKNNAWYFNFKSKPKESEINIDHNEFMGQSLIMFINHKIYDENNNMIGATGVGLKTSYINDMLKYFRERYSFNVFFVNKQGEVFIAEQGINKLERINLHPEFKVLMSDMVKDEKPLFEYEESGESYLLTKKYVEELDLFLIVEAKVDNFTQSVKEAFYFNIIVYLFITLLITLIVLFYVRNIHATLMALASNDSLTDLPNRRTFFSRFKRLISLKQRNKQKLSLVFFDIDDFKQVNDAQGHDVGDKVLIEIASILKTTIRHTDVVARWGGEEFIILLVDSTLEDAQKTAEQLRKNIENSATLIEHAKQKVTVSLGVTEVRESEDTDSLFKRVDNALYQAKKDGKNCVSIID